MNALALAEDMMTWLENADSVANKELGAAKAQAYAAIAQAQAAQRQAVALEKIAAALYTSDGDLHVLDALYAIAATMSNRL